MLTSFIVKKYELFLGCIFIVADKTVFIYLHTILQEKVADAIIFEFNKIQPIPTSR